MLREHNLPVIDADLIAREVVEPGKPAYKSIVRHFGTGILQEDGTLDRKKLGDIIFKDPKQRNVLNGITHPAVQKALLWGVLSSWWRGNSVCILDIPLLIETGLWKLCGYVVVIAW